MPLTQAQIATIQRSASLGQAQLYAKAWGVGDQQLADILRTSTIGTLLPKIEQQHIQAGTPVPKQATEFKQLIERHPQEAKYDIRGAVESIKPDSSEVSGKLKGTAIDTGIKVSVDIPMTQTELNQVAKHNAQATCQGDMQEASIYKVQAWDKNHKWVTLTVQETNKEDAIQKAAEAGYKPMWASKQIGTASTTKEVKVSTKSEATIKVKDGKTGETLEFPKEGWNAWPDKYKKLVKTEGFDAAMIEFEWDYRELPDGQWILWSDLNEFPKKYYHIAITEGLTAMQQAFKTDHVELGDDQWITTKDWDALVANDKTQGTNFAEIGKMKGYDAMLAAIDKANEPYEEFQQKIKSGDIIPVAGNQYITKEEYNKLPSGSQQILKEQGFEALATATTIMYEKGPKPKLSLLAGASGKARYERRLAIWESLPQTITQEQMNEIPFADKDLFHISQDSLGRAGLVILSSFMPPAKAALPEYTMADITAVDWGIAAAQVPLITLGFAPGAVTSSIAGKVATVAGSAALSGMIGYGTAKNWANLTPEQRAMGVGMATLCAVPLMTTVARNVKVSGTSIPTVGEGYIISWKGLSVAGYPIIGRSGGKWVLGTRGITLPEARMILNGYKPEMMLETKVFVNRAALEKAGFTKVQIDYLADTLKARNLFAGKTSPWLDKNVLIEPTQRLNTSEINAIMQRLAKLDKGGLKDAHLFYGSPTIKAQLAPELRGWRAIHDWDISLNMNQAQTEAFTQALLKDLRAKGGGAYRISPQSSTLIEKRIGGRWEHIADIHSQEAVITSAVDLPSSKLDVTSDYSYGRMVSEPAITIKYPGIGELRIMRLSESGVRKADTILRVRQTGEGTAFKPPERGIAQPGVPKDAADFYVTLRTFQGEAVAEEWLKSWAKAMGYTEDWLIQVMKKTRTGIKPPTANWSDWVNTTLKNEMLNVASQTPSSIIGYEFQPYGSARVPVGASPSIVVHVPSSLGASVSASLERRISQPIYPYKLAKSPEVQVAISAGISGLLSKSPVSKISPSVARSIVASTSPKPSPSPAVSKVPSPSPKPSPSIVPSIPFSGKPSPSAKPSKAPSPTPSPKPSPVPSPTPTPSPKPSLYPYPYPKPGPKPKPLPPTSTAKPSKKIKRSGPALAVWKMGRVWVSVFPPFRTTGLQEDVVYSREKPPWGSVIARGRHAPKKTLRSIGPVPELIEVPMGVVTARIRNGRTLTFSRRNGRRRGKVIEG